MHAALQLSRESQHAYQQLRSFVTTSASERIARLMVDWSHDDSGMATAHGIRVALTHDEIGQIIGMSRETLPARSPLFASSTLRNFMVPRC